VTAEDGVTDDTESYGKEPAEIADCAEEFEYDEELAFVEGKAVISISVQNRIESHRCQTSKHERSSER
jgi:hypothetical protein